VSRGGNTGDGRAARRHSSGSIDVAKWPIFGKDIPRFGPAYSTPIRSRRGKEVRIMAVGDDQWVRNNENWLRDLRIPEEDWHQFELAGLVFCPPHVLNELVETVIDSESYTIEAQDNTPKTLHALRSHQHDAEVLVRRQGRIVAISREHNHAEYNSDESDSVTVEHDYTFIAGRSFSLAPLILNFIKPGSA
jgi:hypothetical protein